MTVYSKSQLTTRLVDGYLVRGQDMSDLINSYEDINHSSRVHSVKEFGALGDGTSHPLSSGAAAAYNTKYASIGLPTVVAGDENDWAACMSCMLQCSVDGYDCYFPAGDYYVNRNLTLNWTPTPVTGQPAFPNLERIYGDGQYLTFITANNLQTQYRAIMELIGTNNTYAVDCVLEKMGVHALPNCDPLVYGLLVGDCNAYCKVNRFQTLCNNGLLMKIASSATYAQVGTEFTECNFYANYGQLYSTEENSISYAVDGNSVQGGASWDNVLFQNCVFGGLVEPRASIVVFEDCQFFGSSRRSTDDGHFHNSSLVVLIGSCTVRDCYFEDHYYGMVIANDLSNINNVSITNTHFSGINNDSGAPLTQIGILVAAAINGFNIGTVSIIGCQFNDPGYVQASMATIGVSVCDLGNCDIDNPTTRELTRLNSFGAGMYQGATGLINIVDLNITDTTLTSIQTAGGLTAANDVTSATQCVAPVMFAPRLGTGIGNAQTWGLEVQNPTAGDAATFGMTSTTYTTGGNIAWALDSMPFIYAPATGAGVMRMGVGIGSTCVELSPTVFNGIGVTLSSDTQISCYNFFAPRVGTGSTAGTNWGYSIANAAASDSFTIGWLATNYLTGGAIGWAINDSGFIYIPSTKVLRVGVGIGSTNYFEFSTGEFTFGDGQNMAFNTGTGTQIGTATGQKIGFYGSSPVAQPSGDILVALAALGLISSPTISGTVDWTHPGTIGSATPNTAVFTACEIDRVGTGGTAGTSWGLVIQNAGASDGFEFGWTATNFTTGGGIPWLGNNQGFIYIPGGFHMRIGAGTSSNYWDFADTLLTFHGQSMTTDSPITSTLAIGTAPITVTSTTACPNLNASLLLGKTWAAPGAIGGTTPGTATFTGLTLNGSGGALMVLKQLTSNGAVTVAALLNTEIPVFTGANGSIGGSHGGVPTPAATDNTKFLRGDATWASVAAGGLTSGANEGSGTYTWLDTGTSTSSTLEFRSMYAGTGITVTSADAGAAWSVAVNWASPGAALGSVAPQLATFTGATVNRTGAGNGNGVTWQFTVQNAGASDGLDLGWTSTTYTTGGTLPWAGNDMGYLYIPGGKVLRVGVGTSSNYVEYNTTQLNVVGLVITTSATGSNSINTAGGFTSTVATGTAPLTVTSTTACPNLNSSLLLGNTWASPGAIGGTAASTATFTTLTLSGTGGALKVLKQLTASGAVTVAALLNTEIPVFTGSTGTVAGTTGGVPAPGATDNTKFLRGDSTWQTVTGGGGTVTGGANEGSGSYTWLDTGTSTSTTLEFRSMYAGTGITVSSADAGAAWSIAVNWASPGAALGSTTPQAATFTGTTVNRTGTGAGNGVTWQYVVQNAGASDGLDLGWSSTTYTTGGVLPWLGNDMAFIYVPGTKHLRIGVGTSSNYWDFADTLLTCVGQAFTTNSTITVTTQTGAGSISTSGGLTSTVATGTAPITVTSTTVCPNLNATYLGGQTFGNPGPIGNASASSGNFTTLSGTTITATTSIDVTAAVTGNVFMRVHNTAAGTGNYARLEVDADATSFIIYTFSSTYSGHANEVWLETAGGPSPIIFAINAIEVMRLTSTGLTTGSQVTSTVTTGTAPFVVASTTAVANLNASLLLGNTWAAPGTIGGTTPGAATFTNLTLSTTPLAISSGGTGATTFAAHALLIGPTSGGAAAPTVRVLSPSDLPGRVALTDGTTIATDASLGCVFDVTIAGSRTLSNPTNPTDGQRVTWRIKQDATGGRGLAFDTKFRFGTGVTGFTPTATASKTDYIGAIYNLASDTWDIVAVTQGY